MVVLQANILSINKKLKILSSMVIRCWLVSKGVAIRWGAGGMQVSSHDHSNTLETETVLWCDGARWTGNMEETLNLIPTLTARVVGLCWLTGRFGCNES